MIQKEAKEMSVYNLNLMKHALGIGRGGNRNYYVIGSGCDDHKLWMSLVKKGYAVSSKNSLSSDDVFHVTKKGKEFVRIYGE